MTDKQKTSPDADFQALGLPVPVADTIAALGYHRPTPIQVSSIPVLMSRQDLIGRAPTGTGKTAAFGLPLLSCIDADTRRVQAVILTPTRELAIQVAEALGKFATGLKGVGVLAVYGGQNYGQQIRAIKAGAQVVVGTPGRIMDHLKRGNLVLDHLHTLVLDEADEMLRMGFIDDVEWILERTPDTRQTALFSATMPQAIRRIASRYLKDPREITIQREVERANDIRQRVWTVKGAPKLEALGRILEVEDSDGVLVFVRTRHATQEIADALSARGFNAAAINGDMQQAERERTVDKLKNGSIKALVATDVVARGLDVDRITHVINFDVPFDAEAYVHRIGRTGRAGRRGEAILFVTPRERRLINVIERATRSRMETLTLPDVATVNEHRVARFLASIDDTIRATSLERLESILNSHAENTGVPITRIAAALAHRSLAGQALFLKADKRAERKSARPERTAPDGRGHSPHAKTRSDKPKEQRSPRPRRESNIDFENYRAEVGHTHGVKASHLVGAIANEADIDSAFIGKIRVNADHSLIELPSGMPKPILRDLRKAWVLGQRLQLSLVSSSDKKSGGFRPPKRADSQRKRTSKPRRAVS